jgi:hypothetical protein
MSTDFDAISEARELANTYPSRAGRKLTFSQRCSAYAALLEGTSQVLVATAFRLSRASISALANCRKDTRGPVTMELAGRTYKVGELNVTPRRRDGQRRYQEVAQEFERLGYEPFMQTYFTPDIKARIKEAARKRPVYGVPDPGADRYAFANAGEITDKWGEKFQINFVTSRIGEGWQFIVSRNGIPSERHEYNGDDKDKPFMSSDAARAFLLGL